MAKKKKAPPREERRAAAEYYKLNTKAVDDLVNADESNSPPVSEEELRKYRSGLNVKLADWLKIALIKAWFIGAVCFYFMWGLGNYLTNGLDQIVITGLAMGFVMDILVNNLLRFMEKSPGGNDRWMMCPKKGFVSLPLNVVYCLLLMLCTVTTYTAINLAINAITGSPDAVPLGVEPVFFGIFVVLWDALFIRMKHVLQRIVADAKQQTRRGR